MPTQRPTSRRTVLFDVHRRAGAHFTEFAGWTMPLRYSSETAEHRAVRNAAGLFDLSHMGEIEVAGPGAGAALDHAVVTKPSTMATGQARYSLICNKEGGILDDLIVYRLSHDRYMVVTNASNISAVTSALAQRSINYEAIVRDATCEWGLIAIQGPAAATILGQIAEANLDALNYYTVTMSRLLDVEVLIARTGYTGEDVFEVYCATTAAEQLWTGLSTAGLADGLAPAGLASRDTLRLEAGMPLHGNELSTKVTPFEVGLGRLVNFDKIDGFVGQAALAERRDAKASQVLAGLVTQGRRSPRSGHHVVDPLSGRTVGRITSGAPSPTLGHPVAIASLQLGYVSPGTQLVVDVRGTSEPAEVVSLPFYRRTQTGDPR